MIECRTLFWDIVFIKIITLRWLVGLYEVRASTRLRDLGWTKSNISRKEYRNIKIYKKLKVNGIICQIKNL